MTWIKHPAPDPWALLEPRAYVEYLWGLVYPWHRTLWAILLTLRITKDPVGHRILVMQHAVTLWRYIHWLQDGPLCFSRQEAYKEALNYARP